MTEKTAKGDLFITHPGFGRVFHIFHRTGLDANRALCGGAMMLVVDPEKCEPVNGDERYVKGQDCKACWRKSGLLSSPSKATEGEER